MLCVNVPEELDMVRLGEVLGKLLPEDCVLGLEGDLGVGKTTLVQGIAAGLGIQGTITSPTFTIVKEYWGERRLIHIDVYRLEDAEEILFLGFDEMLNNGGIIVIEWSDKVREYLPPDRLELIIRKAGGDSRSVNIVDVCGAYHKLLKELKDRVSTGGGECHQCG